ncbi:sorbosone dehydrogenase family protein [Modestobacter sp. Leaf380]|uniref:PQQ-dependent sugar dehydrogenase n=1 Tax=Modestobacter sp. Leaf380 TaxID=1736356 RepID=UPI0006F7C9E4|nr:PQQ-dependent sugar dehydrogenase [Modestobacter sp. Leaf380]KQS73576.1 glucose sorbosone dehydrogenase [Modestobacter sp. Leaf380]
MGNPRTARLTALLAGAVLLAGCSAADSADAADAAAEPPAGAPALQVETVLDGLDHPWDVAQAPDGTLLLDERDGRLTVVLPDGTSRALDADLDDVWAEGETGLMGLVLDPAFDDSRRFYTCSGITDGGADGGPGIEVTAWTVDEGWTAATRVADPLVGGIPVNADSGRHGGCRLRFDDAGQLLVGTGDNAVGTNAQDLSTLAGKVLRVDPQTGQPSAGNPFLELTDPTSHAIVGYGHRNVQGLAVRPGTGAVFTAEQGSQVDDEVNLATDGGNYGWDPVGAGDYDESVPMTDTEIPGAIEAVWSSGDPTIAVSGITFLDGEEWGAYDGLLLLGVQKDTGVLALRLGEDGSLVEQFRVPELEGTYGRVRSPQLGADGALYLTTDNGDGEDQLLRVTPAS